MLYKNRWAKHNNLGELQDFFCLKLINFYIADKTFVFLDWFLVAEKKAPQNVNLSRDRS